MAKLSELASEMLSAEEDRYTVDLFGQKLPFKVSNYGLRKLRDRGLDPLASYFRVAEKSQAALDLEALQTKTVAELREIASGLDVEGYADMRKADLVQAVAQEQAGTVEFTTEEYLDIQALGFAGLVTYDQELKFDTFEKMVGFSDLEKLVPPIMQSMTGAGRDQADSDEKPVKPDESVKGEEGKG